MGHLRSLFLVIAICFRLLFYNVSGQGTLSIESDSGQPARILLISDTHIVSPQQDLQDRGSNAVDKASVLKSHQRLWRVLRDKVAALEPPPQLAVFGGDLVHDGFVFSQDLKTIVHGPFNGFHIARGILEELRMPLVMAFGNHDQKVDCGSPETSAPRHVTAATIKHFLGADPYTAVDIGGWKVLVLNSELGYTWQADHPGCNTRLSSYGCRQLLWAERHLSKGAPTVVVMHYPLPTSVPNEDPDCPVHDIVSLLSSHENIKLVLSGHFHKGYDWGELYPFPHLTLPATRFDPDNFLLLELYHNGSFSLPDWPKNKGGSRCSNTWEYGPNVGAAGGVGVDADPGDCGMPLAEDADYSLPPITSLQDVPQDFSPELSCSVKLGKQILGPCMQGGASKECCDILAATVTPMASHDFTGCLCQPAFWKEMEGAFDAAGQNLTAVIDACIDSTHALILHRGAGACPPAEKAASAGKQSLRVRLRGLPMEMVQTDARAAVR